MSTLDPRIQQLKDDYELADSDMWQLPQNKSTWLIKHAALEVVAAKAGITFEPPQIIESDGAGGIVSICVTGHFDKRVEWSFGEANPKNSKTSYPYAIAEKRAKDRVILKLVGIHGLLYSEDEMDTAHEPDDTPAAARSRRDNREFYDWLAQQIRKTTSIDKLRELWEAHWENIDRLPDDWKTNVTLYKDERKAELADRKGTPTVKPDFDHLPEEPARAS